MSLKRVVTPVVDFAATRPWIVLGASAAMLLGCLLFARRLELRADFIELLPRDSPAFRAFEHQLGRVGGGATFLIGIESPDRKANERLVDDLAAALEAERAERSRCGPRCGAEPIAFVESGTRDVRKFFEENKWLYASLDDLEDADRELDRQIALRSGLVEDLFDDEAAPSANKGAPGDPPSAGVTGPPRKPALGLDAYRARWDRAAQRMNDFPTGYFANDDGTTMVLRIVTNASGMGGASGDAFLEAMARRVSSMDVTHRYNPQMRVGFAGDIPNAVAEKQAILGQAFWATAAALLLILGGIVLYYRSVASLIVIIVPAVLGVSAAYAFATAVFGYVNLPGAFLGAIILGNGINYPIVLLSRYREFCARGMAKRAARVEAVLNAFRSELVGACVASIAYGSLTITQFRGFSQFGAIGFVGMLFVWLSIIPVVPALVVVVERAELKLGRRDMADGMRSDGSSGPLLRWLAKTTERRPVPIVLAASAVCAVAASLLPGYFRDPWEYDFSKLDSRSSKTGGAGEWSNRVDAVFQGKQNISGVLLLADSANQTPLVKAKILASDAADPRGRLIDDIVTLDDFLPGPREEQIAKLAVLARLRERLSPRIVDDLPPDERIRVREMIPPDGLRVVEGKDLPALIRRRFEENDGRIGTPMYVKYKFGVSFSNGHTLLRMAKATDAVVLDDGTVVQTASRATIFAEMVRSMQRDGPFATAAAFLAVSLVIILATRTRRGASSVLLALVMGVTCLVGFAATTGTKLNFLNFIALPITFGIGCEYPFNVYDRTRLLRGDIASALARTGGAVALCSYTTIVGYASMLFSDNGALRSFGTLAMFGEVACVSMALLFLPALLHVLSGTARGRRAESEA
ncbi:MAG: MMPL family transporter [Polyangiaceae bacterium]|jgi:predicted RND superfamily exporter protein